MTVPLPEPLRLRLAAWRIMPDIPADLSVMTDSDLLESRSSLILSLLVSDLQSGCISAQAAMTFRRVWLGWRRDRGIHKGTWIWGEDLAAWKQDILLWEACGDTEAAAPRSREIRTTIHVPELVCILELAHEATASSVWHDLPSVVVAREFVPRTPYELPASIRERFVTALARHISTAAFSPAFIEDAARWLVSRLRPDDLIEALVALGPARTIGHRQAVLRAMNLSDFPLSPPSRLRLLGLLMG